MDNPQKPFQWAEDMGEVTGENVVRAISGEEYANTGTIAMHHFVVGLIRRMRREWPDPHAMDNPNPDMWEDLPGEPIINYGPTPQAYINWAEQLEVANQATDQGYQGHPDPMAYAANAIALALDNVHLRRLVEQLSEVSHLCDESPLGHRQKIRQDFDSGAIL